MKTCRDCGQTKPFEEFQKLKGYADSRNPRCKQCFSIVKASEYKDRWFVYQSRLKKSFCKKNGIEFDLTPDYLESIWTDMCPVYKVPFVRFDKSHPNSPALDRINPLKGYIKGNVQYISARANRIKYDASVEELRLILDFLEGATTISKESTPKRVEAPDPT